MRETAASREKKDAEESRAVSRAKAVKIQTHTHVHTHASHIVRDMRLNVFVAVNQTRQNSALPLQPAAG